MKYLAAAGALMAALCVYAFFAGLAANSLRTHVRPATGASHRNCLQLTIHPSTVACSDKRTYLLPGWTDIGPVTPVPGVPRR